jgi:hypothetical protein
MNTNYSDKVIEAFKINQPDMEMTGEDFRLLMSMMMSKDENLNKNVNDLDKSSEIYIHFQPLIDSFVSQVFLKRVEVCTSLKISLGALIILLLYMENPRNAVIYTYYLDYKLEPNTLVTLTVFGEKAFSWGMFSPIQLDNIWDAMQPEKKTQKNTNVVVKWFNTAISWITSKFEKTL